MATLWPRSSSSTHTSLDRCRDHGQDKRTTLLYTFMRQEEP